jgi:hypothetical protein
MGTVAENRGMELPSEARAKSSPKVDSERQGVALDLLAQAESRSVCKKTIRAKAMNRYFVETVILIEPDASK